MSRPVAGEMDAGVSDVVDSVVDQSNRGAGTAVTLEATYAELGIANIQTNSMNMVPSAPVAVPPSLSPR